MWLTVFPQLSPFFLPTSLSFSSTISLSPLYRSLLSYHSLSLSPVKHAVAAESNRCHLNANTPRLSLWPHTHTHTHTHTDTHTHTHTTTTLTPTTTHTH